MAAALLVEIAATSPAGEAVTLRFTDRAIRPLPPGDADRPNIAYDDRILQPPSLERSLFSDLSTLKPTFGVGSMTLANADGGLDAYQGHVWGEISVREWTIGTAFSASTVLIKGLCAPPSYPSASGSPAQVKVGLYDFRAEVSKPVQSTVYAGTNGVGGVLYEGAADGLKGVVKPWACGNLLDAHIPAPQVNAGVQAYQLHDGQILGDEQVFDRGDDAGLVDDGDASGAAFDAATPAASHYKTDHGRGLLKTNFSPVGQVAFGFKADAGGGYVETPGPVIARILGKAGVPGGRIGASIAALTSTAVVGVYAAQNSRADELIGLVAACVPAAINPDRAGVWQAVPFAAPAETADAEIAFDQVINLAADDTAPLPAGEVRVGWGRIYTTYAGADLAPDLVNTPSQERLAAEYRWAVAADATTKARLPSTWRTLEIPTALRVEADAQALADTLRDLFALRADGKPRRQWRVTIERSLLAGFGLGDTVRLIYPPRGLDENYLVLGEDVMRPRRDQAILTVWG